MEQCVIFGYQSHPSVNAYLIELIDQQGDVIFQGNLSFSANTIEYVPISPIPLQAGSTYTLRRSCLQHDWIDETIGRILKEENNQIAIDTLTLPVGDDLITITDVDFYGHGDPPNNAIPFIDFGFME